MWAEGICQALGLSLHDWLVLADHLTGSQGLGLWVTESARLSLPGRLSDSA